LYNRTYTLQIMNYKLQITNFKFKKIFFVFFVLLSTFYFLLSTSPVYAIDLQIPIRYPNGVLDSFEVCDNDTVNQIQCDGISKYIIVGIKWLVSAVGILVMVVFAWAGILWLTARGDSKQVKQAQKLLKDGIAGIVLTLGSYLILWTINPNMVDLKPLIIKKTQPLTLDYDTEIQSETGAGYSGPGVPLAGFTNVTFEGEKEKSDISGGRIDSTMTNLLKAIDAAGFQVVVTSSRKGREGERSHHAGGYALDISASPYSKLAEVAKFLYDNHRDKIDEMFFTDVSQPPIMDSGTRIDYGTYLGINYLDRGPGALAEAHKDHLHISVKHGLDTKEDAPFRDP